MFKELKEIRRITYEHIEYINKETLLKGAKQILQLQI